MSEAVSLIFLRRQKVRVLGNKLRDQRSHFSLSQSVLIPVWRRGLVSSPGSDYPPVSQCLALSLASGHQHWPLIGREPILPWGRCICRNLKSLTVWYFLSPRLVRLCVTGTENMTIDGGPVHNNLSSLQTQHKWWSIQHKIHLWRISRKSSTIITHIKAKLDLAFNNVNNVLN